MEASLQAIEYYLPETILNNEQLAHEFGWSVEKIESKTGVDERRIAAPDECASDLAVKAAQRLFRSGVSPDDVDYLLFCSQASDYLFPATACLLQRRLGIPTRAGAVDFGLGCAGYVCGLSLAKGLIESGQVRNVLLLTAETVTKYLDPKDRSARTLIGDAATATWIVGRPAESETPALGPVVFGTDGAGADHLIIRKGGARHGPRGADKDSYFFMNGGEVFAFTLRVVPGAVKRLLELAGLALADVDRFVFHQANRYMLDHLRDKIGIPEEKFIVDMSDCGNTSSNTIAIALKRALEKGRILAGQRVMLVGFGVGFTWGAVMVRWG